MRNKFFIPIAAVLIFFALGFKLISLYSVWDDEANTALFAQTVASTGDTSAVFHHNVIAYRGGAELNTDLKARYVPPLQYFFLAPFVKDHDSQSARFPFLILTLISIGWILFRLGQMKFKTHLIAGCVLVLIGMTSFLLFGIQSRYYALTFLLSVIAADLYWFKEIQNKKNLFFFGLLTSLIFISNYLMGVALIAALGLHFFIFRRKDFYEVLKKIHFFALPHLLISLPVLWIWNPVGKKVVTQQNTALDKANLVFRNFRDFNGGMLGSLLLLILGLFLLKDPKAKNRFREYGLILLTYIVTISVFSPQPIQGTVLADIRYLYPLMLLSLTWTIDFWNSVTARKSYYWLGLSFFAVCALPYNGKIEFPVVELFQEIIHPADDPYRLTGDWLREQAKPRSTVLSSLDYATYPLMFLAPDLKYLGQFEAASEKIDADYLISFCDETILNRTPEPSKYQLAVQFQSACREAYRPELFFRSFGKNNGSGTLKIFSKIK